MLNSCSVPLPGELFSPLFLSGCLPRSFLFVCVGVFFSFVVVGVVCVPCFVVGGVSRGSCGGVLRGARWGVWWVRWALAALGPPPSCWLVRSFPPLLPCPLLPCPLLLLPLPLSPPIVLRACLRASPHFFGPRLGTCWPVCMPPCAVRFHCGFIDGYRPPADPPVGSPWLALGGLALRVPTRGGKERTFGGSPHFDK